MHPILLVTEIKPGHILRLLEVIKRVIQLGAKIIIFTHDGVQLLLLLDNFENAASGAAGVPSSSGGSGSSGPSSPKFDM